MISLAWNGRFEIPSIKTGILSILQIAGNENQHPCEGREHVGTPRDSNTHFEKERVSCSELCISVKCPRLVVLDFDQTPWCATSGLLARRGKQKALEFK